MPQISFSTDKQLLHPIIIHHFLSTQSYWAEQIPGELVEKAVQNSFCVGGYTETGEQVSFARLVTDYATFAYLADVFVLPHYRGQGISKQMLQFLFSQDWVPGLRRIMLATADAQSLYKKLGFTEIDKPERLMQIVKPGIYKVIE